MTAMAVNERMRGNIIVDTQGSGIWMSTLMKNELAEVRFTQILDDSNQAMTLAADSLKFAKRLFLADRAGRPGILPGWRLPP